MLLALIGGQVIRSQVIRGQLTQNSSYDIAWSVGLNPNMTFQIKVSEDRSFGKCFPQLIKGLFSVGG